MNVIGVVSKVPWTKVGKVAKVVGVTALGTASIIKATETDEKTQKMLMKIASKVVKDEVESN